MQIETWGDGQLLEVLCVPSPTENRYGDAGGEMERAEKVYFRSVALSPSPPGFLAPAVIPFFSLIPACLWIFSLLTFLSCLLSSSFVFSSFSLLYFSFSQHAIFYSSGTVFKLHTYCMCCSRQFLSLHSCLMCSHATVANLPLIWWRFCINTETELKNRKC